MVPNVQVVFPNVGGEKGWLILLVRLNAFLLHTEEFCNFILGLVVGISILFCLWLLANCVRYVCVCHLWRNFGNFKWSCGASCWFWVCGVGANIQGFVSAWGFDWFNLWFFQVSFSVGWGSEAEIGILACEFEAYLDVGWWGFESFCFYVVANCVRYVEIGTLMQAYGGCRCWCWDCGLLVNVQGFVNAGEKVWLIQLIFTWDQPSEEPIGREEEWGAKCRDG